MKLDLTPIDPLKLYRKTPYNDEQGTTICEITPVYVADDGRIVDDPIRQLRYEGLVFVGGRPITFKIELATNLREACELFPVAVQKVIDDLESQQLQAKLLAASNSRAPR